MIYLLLLAIYVISRKHFTIWRSDSKKYLTRVYIVGKWFRAVFNCRPYLHIFWSSDDEEFHNHRWKWSYGIPLWRGYKEQRRTAMEVFYNGESQGKSFEYGWGQTEREIRPFRINRLDSDCFHRVDLLGGICITLFLAGPHDTDDWGFLRDDGTIEYARERFVGRRDDLSDD